MIHKGGKNCVYFIRPIGQLGPVKVGHSIYPASRLFTYLQWSPIPLEVVAVLQFSVPDDEPSRKFAMAVERRFHSRYAEHWLHHEWFATHDRLTRDIELIQRGRFRMSLVGETQKRLRDKTDVWGPARGAPRQTVSA